MANELKWVSATSQMVASDSTATIAAAAFSTSVVTTLTSTEHSNYPWADAVLTFSGTNSISSASNYINLYRRDMNIDGTADAPTPSTTYSAATPSQYGATFVGAFIAPAFTSATSYSAVSLPLPDIPLSKECVFYIENKLNSPIGAGWTLKITPKSYVPG